MQVRALFRRDAQAACRAHSPPRKGPSEAAAEADRRQPVPANPAT